MLDSQVILASAFQRGNFDDEILNLDYESNLNIGAQSTRPAQPAFAQLILTLLLQVMLTPRHVVACCRLPASA